MELTVRWPRAVFVIDDGHVPMLKTSMTVHAKRDTGTDQIGTNQQHPARHTLDRCMDEWRKAHLGHHFNGENDPENAAS